MFRMLVFNWNFGFQNLQDNLFLFQAGFKMYLGITPVVSNWSPAGDEFSLLIENNPLTEFVELPEGHNALNYSNILCGALKGCLEMVSIRFFISFSFFFFFFFFLHLAFIPGLGQ